MKKDVKAFIDAIKNDTKRKDSLRLVKLMQDASGYKASLCGKIIGYGLYHYKYDSGREGDAIVTGFSPRQQYISIYIMPGFSKYKKELAQLGKHKTAQSCLYINKLADIDEKILSKIVTDSVAQMQKKYECRKT